MENKTVKVTMYLDVSDVDAVKAISWPEIKTVHGVHVEETGSNAKTVETHPKIVIPVENGASIVAEQGYDDNYRELFVYLQANDGSVIQDLAIVRNAYEYDDDLNTIQKPDEFEVLVYADEDDEDYTDRFEIKRYQEPEE